MNSKRINRNVWALTLTLCLGVIGISSLSAQTGEERRGAAIAQPVEQARVVPKKVVLPGNPQAQEMASALCRDAQAYVAAQASRRVPVGPVKLPALERLAANCTNPSPAKQFACNWANGNSMSGPCDEPGHSICQDMESMCIAGGGVFTS